MGRLLESIKTAPRWAQLSLVAFAVAAATPIAIIPGVNATEAVVKASGLGNLLDRSPGTRTDALLEKVKAAVGGDEASEDEPTQRALGKIFDTPVAAAVAAGPAVIFPNEDVPTPFAPVSDIASLPGAGSAPAGATGGGIPRIFAPDAAVGGGGGGGVGGGGGAGAGGGGGGSGGDGGTGGGGGGTPVTPDVTNPSAVPEPGTWMLMLLGMAMTGAALRYDRKQVGSKKADAATAI